MPRDFSGIDNPEENLTLGTEAKSKMSDEFAQAHIDYINSGLLDKQNK